DLDLANVRGRDDDQGPRIEAAAGLEQEIAGREVRAAAADVTRLARWRGEAGELTLAAHVLLDHDPAGAGGQRSAGENAYAFAGVHGSGKAAPGERLSRHAQAPGKIGFAHCITIHRRDVGRR